MRYKVTHCNLTGSPFDKTYCFKSMMYIFLLKNFMLKFSILHPFI